MPSASRDAAAEDRQSDGAVAARESITLPLIFLTVTLGGGFRASAATGEFRFAPPALIYLVLAILVLTVLVRSAALDPHALMGVWRRPIENLTGAVVLATLFSATAQLLNALTPDSGLLHFIFVVFFGLLFWNTLAIRPGRLRSLHSLLVVFGSALVLKHVVLAALYDPQGSLTKRVLMTLLEGVTLGGLQYEPAAPATGYAAFATTVLYFVGLLLLPRAAPGRESAGTVAVALPGGPRGMPPLLDG